MLSMEAYLSLYDSTKEPKWLERAKAAADFTESWIWIWNVPMPLDADDAQLHWKKGVPALGFQGITAAVAGSVDEYLDWAVPSYAKLYNLTKDQHYLDVARVLLHDTKSMVALPGRQYDLKGIGWQQEGWRMGPGGSGRGVGGHRFWLPWISANHLYGITGLEEYDPALFKTAVHQTLRTSGQNRIIVKTKAGTNLVVMLVLVGAALTMAQQNAPAPARPQGPCDIYGAARTPCVAAHSTTRALSASYNGPLYQVLRRSDGKTLDIGLTPGCGWIRRRGCAGRFLRQYDLRHQPDLRPVRQGQPPLPGAARTAIPGTGEGRIRHPTHRGHGASHDLRPQGLRRLHHAGHGAAQQRCQRHRHRRRAGGHLLRHRRHALR